MKSFVGVLTCLRVCLMIVGLLVGLFVRRCVPTMLRRRITVCFSIRRTDRFYMSALRVKSLPGFSQGDQDTSALRRALHLALHPSLNLRERVRHLIGCFLVPSSTRAASERARRQ